jgi:H3 lysine-79-specific histone-lysine N-methyltransferase
MAFLFGTNAKTSKIKVAPPQIRVVKATAPKKPTPLPSRERLNSRPEPGPSRPSSSSSAKPKPKARIKERESDDNRLAAPGKRKAARQMSPAQLIFDSSSDDEDEDEEGSPKPDEFAEKRLKQRQDFERRLRSRQAFSEQDGGKFAMIHAADLEVPVLKKSLAASAVGAETVMVEFKYPSASQLERYVFGAVLVGF